MMVTRLFRLCFSFWLVLLAFSFDAKAQGWTQLHSFDGYICLAKFLDQNTGFVGLGVSPGKSVPGPAPVALYKTTDGGTSWIQCTIPAGYSGQIGDLIMVDSLHGWLAMTAWGGQGNKALWKTSDAGVTWNETSLVGSGTSVVITPTAMLVTDIASNGHLSTDGGNTFTNGFLSSTNCVNFVDALHGVISDYRGENWVNSSDGGLTWQTCDMTVESWTVYPDSGTSTFFAAPEGPTNGSAYNAIIYRSTNYGVRWGQLATFPFIFTGHLTGLGDKYLFFQVQDVKNVIGNITYAGYYYSTDQGVTWTSIGGPAGHNDTRFSVINGCSGIMLYGFDDQSPGTLYRYSFGSGGNGPTSLSISNSNTELIVKQCMVPVDSSVYLAIEGCIPSQASLDSLWLTGSGTIKIADTRSAPRTLGTLDSVLVSFTSTNGPDTATLHLRYNLGKGDLDTTITIIGRLDSTLHPQSIVTQQAVTLKQASCVSVDSSVPIGYIGCGSGGTLDSAWIVGSTVFSINDSRTNPRMLASSDSILVSYDGSGGADTAVLHLQYDLGSGIRDTTVQLIGSTSPLVAHPLQLHRESASAYYGQIDSLPLGVDVGSQVNIDSLWPYLTEISASYTWDSTVATSYGYLPPNGWSLAGLTSHSNSVDFDIQNNSSTATTPLDLGTALFKPLTTQFATSWVTMPSVTMDIGNENTTLCVTDNEDNHWVVKTLGVLSGVAEAQQPPQDIAIYPNPADEALFIENPNPIPVKIAIYDAIGRTLASSIVEPKLTTTIDLSLFPNGVYFVVGEIGNKVLIKNIYKSKQ